MKKIFLVALAAIGMTACMQDEVVEIANGGAIAFDNAFVGNATRAEVTTTNLEAFKVWGKVHGENGSYGVVFNGEPVNKVNGTWTYTETQYWMPNNAYSFAAIAPDSAVSADWDLNASRTIEFTTNGTVDLVYAAKEVAATTDTYEKVAFQFEHLLSKVKLSFATDLPAGNEVSIENLQVVTAETASIDLTNKTWTLAGNTFTFEPALTDNKTDDYFVLPADFNISFDVVIKVGNVEVYNENKTSTVLADVFEMGHAYNLSAVINPATLDLDEIVFDVEEVKEWEEGYNPANAAVSTTAELQAAINDGNSHIYLAENTTFEGTVVMKSNVTIEGLAGAVMHNINLNGSKNVTLKNIIFDAANAIPCVDGAGNYKVYANIVTGVWQEAQANIGAHNLVVDGCTFTGSFKSGKPGAAIALTDDERNSGYSGNITVKNCTFDTVTDYGGYDIYGYYVGDAVNGHDYFVIENNTFKSTRPNGGPVYLGKYASSTPVVVKGNVFETVTNLEGAVYVQDHSNYGVSVDASGNTFAN